MEETEEKVQSDKPVQAMPTDPAPSLSGSEKVEMLNWSDTMRAHLKASPKRTVLVPATCGMAERTNYKGFIEVMVNGVSVFVPIGVATAVPEGIADIIEENLVNEVKHEELVQRLANRGIVFEM